MKDEIHGLDECALGGGVGRLHGGSEGDDVEVGVLAQDDGALESGMVDLYDAVLAEELLVLLEQQMEDG